MHRIVCKLELQFTLFDFLYNYQNFITIKIVGVLRQTKETDESYREREEERHVSRLVGVQRGINCVQSSQLLLHAQFST